MNPDALPDPLPDAPCVQSATPPAEWVDASAPPLNLDIGCHRGIFLAAMARAFPEENFLGIEKLPDRVARTQKKIDLQHLGNARVIAAEAATAIRNLPAGRAASIHILFPDPWPKRRHATRRLVDPEFLGLCARTLRPHGLLRILTDNADYAAAIGAGLADQPLLLPSDPGDLPEFPETGFQKNFREAGLAIFTLCARRTGA